MKTAVIAIILALSVTAFADDALDQANAQIARLQAENAKLQSEVEKLKPYAEKALTLPVEITKRPAALGGGEVIQISNTSGKEIKVKVTLSNPGLGISKIYAPMLPAARIETHAIQIGHMEGWTVAPGDEVEIIGEGFLPLKKSIQD